MKYEVMLNGKLYEVEVVKGEAQLISVSDAPAAAPVIPAAAVSAAPAAQAAKPAASYGPGEAVTAPMPGTITDVVVSPGQAVKKGDTLLVLEAMKMGNDIAAPRDGVVASVVAAKGDIVRTGDVLLTLS
ncbi:MAG: biotin/lipoyl-binding protein [Oscillospiraceae bacterium]|jgi:glutaconyl-CoA decarboxylase|nr:biotin/lipoyl-binding protein [Oscillospiraceae bacterium]